VEEQKNNNLIKKNKNFCWETRNEKLARGVQDKKKRISILECVVIIYS
jgi:hypothetical protein